MSNPKDLIGAKKAPMDLVPAAGAIMSAPAHANGAGKYGPFNWRGNPVQLMTYLAAIRRHQDAFTDGQDEAEDTGIHHLSHMLAGMNIIADALALGNLIDNRPPKGPAADMLRAQDHSEKPAPVETPSSFAYKHADGTCPECSTGYGLKDRCAGDGMGDPSTCQTHMAPWPKKNVACDAVGDPMDALAVAVSEDLNRPIAPHDPGRCPECNRPPLHDE